METDEGTEDPAAGPRARSIAGYRAKAMDPAFTLARHLCKTLGVAAVILAGGLWLAIDAAAWHWALLPVFWLVANIFEWGIHRYAMHRPAWPRVLYHNHARIHHNAFAGREQEVVDPRELSLVMMPWYTLIMVFLMASPVALVAAAIGGSALAGVFLIGSVTYFLLYELIHTLHHLPGRLLAPTGVLAGLRAHHHHHHQLERMAHVNFNVTLPIADRVLGTYARPEASLR